MKSSQPFSSFSNLFRIAAFGAFGLLALSSTPHSAHAIVEVAAVGGTDLTFVSDSSTTSYSVKPGYAFGAMGQLDLNPAMGLEVDALYIQRKYGYAAGPFSGDISAKYFMLPVLVRITALPILSVGIGGYYAQAIGDISGTLNGAEFTQSFSSGNISNSDFGGVASVQLKSSLAPFMSLLLDARYILGLKNISTVSGQDKKMRDFQALAGISFGL